MTSKKDSEILMNSILPLAKKMLKEHGEFHPYGGIMLVNGKIIDTGASNNEAFPAGSKLVTILESSFKERLKEGNIKAIGIITNVQVTPPGILEKTDAIQVSLEHCDGYFVNVFYPYHLQNGIEPIYGKIFATKRTPTVFCD